MNLQELRKKIDKESQDWLDKRVPAYITQQADFGDFAPDKFIQVKQYHRLKEKQPNGASQESSSEKEKEETPFTRKGIITTIEDNKRLVILGDPGLGKTTTLQYLTHKYSTDKKGKKPLPIYIKLKECQERYGYLKGVVDESYKALKNKNVIFLLDGFNELNTTTQEQIKLDIKKLSEQYKKSRWVITSRKVAYPTGLDGNWTTCELIDLNDDGITHYIKSVVKAEKANDLYKEITDKGLSSIARIPLFLGFICELAKSGYELPRTKGGILDEIVRQKYLDDESLNKAMSQTNYKNLTIDDCLNHIAPLAYNVFKKTGGITFDEETISSEPKSLFENLRLFEKHEVKDESGTTKRLYSFWHQSFFEYFVGYYLRQLFIEADNKGTLLQTALPYFEYVKWDEAMKMALSLCGKNFANELFTLALKQDIFLALKYLPVVDSQLSKPTEEALLSQLTFKHPQGKVALASTMELNGSPILVPTLIDWLKDEKESYSLREGAAWALGKIATEEAVDALISMLKNKVKHIRHYAIMGLGVSRNKKVFEPIVRMLQNKRIDWVRQAAISVLGELEDPQAIPLLIERINDNNISSLGISIMTLAKFDPQKSVKLTIKLLENKDKEIQKSAIKVLGKLGDLQAGEHLRELLDNPEESDEIRTEAAKALGNLGDTKATDGLMKALKEKNEIYFQQTVATALGRIGNPDVVDDLLQYLEDVNYVPGVRRTIAIELGSLYKNITDDKASNKIINKLIKSLDDENYPVVEGAAIALGDIGSNKALDALISKINYGTKRNDSAMDEIDLTRQEIVWAIAKIRDSKAIAPLISSLKDRRAWYVEKTVVEALGMIGNPDVIPTLINMFSGTDKSLNERIVGALGRIQANMAEDKQPEELIKKPIEIIRKRATEDEEYFKYYVIWSEAAGRRFLKAYKKNEDEYLTLSLRENPIDLHKNYKVKLIGECKKRRYNILINEKEVWIPLQQFGLLYKLSFKRKKDDIGWIHTSEMEISSNPHQAVKKLQDGLKYYLNDNDSDIIENDGHGKYRLTIPSNAIEIDNETIKINHGSFAILS